MQVGDSVVDLAESVQTLKRVLPLMSKQKIPTTPQNYAVWYEFVTRKNDALCKDLEQYLRTGAEITPEVCQDVYNKHFRGDVAKEELEGLRQALQDLVSNVVLSLGTAGQDISRYDKVLARCGDSLNSEIPAAQLKDVVNELIVETRRARERNQQVEQSLNTISKEIGDLRSEVQKLSQDANTDALTGIRNRRAFDRALADMTADANKTGQPLCLALIDIDHFKKFNDTFGHVVGDQVIRFVGRELQSCTKGRDVVARYGGEEFAILLPNTRLEGAFALLDGIRSLIEAQSAVEESFGKGVTGVTISIGVACFKAGETDSAFVERSDQCLYASKQRGRNRVTTETNLAH